MIHLWFSLISLTAHGRFCWCEPSTLLLWDMALHTAFGYHQSGWSEPCYTPYIPVGMKIHWHQYTDFQSGRILNGVIAVSRDLQGLCIQLHKTSKGELFCTPCTQELYHVLLITFVFLVRYQPELISAFNPHCHLYRCIHCCFWATIPSVTTSRELSSTPKHKHFSDKFVWKHARGTLSYYRQPVQLWLINHAPVVDPGPRYLSVCVYDEWERCVYRFGGHPCPTKMFVIFLIMFWRWV